MEKNNYIALLGTNSKSTIILYNAIAEFFPVSIVIIEKKESKTIFLKRRIKKLGLLKVIDQLIFMLTYSKLLTLLSKKRIQTIFKKNKLSLTPIPGHLIKRIDSINDDVVLKLLQKKPHDIIILNGTRIISKKIINSSKGVILNIHAGITPNYRGVHGAYWAFVKNQNYLAGVTLHCVDSGVDTGRVIDQKIIDVIDADNYATYPLLQLSVGIKLLLQFLDMRYSGKIHQGMILGSDNASSQWYHPGFFEYLYNRIFLRVK